MEIYPVTPVLLGVILRFLIVQYFSTLKFLSCSWIIKFLYVCNYISFLDLMLFVIFLFKPKSISLDFYSNHPLVLLILFRLLMLLKVIVLYFHHTLKNSLPSASYVFPSPPLSLLTDAGRLSVFKFLLCSPSLLISPLIIYLPILYATV